MSRTAFGTANIWQRISQFLGMPSLSFRESCGFRKGRPTVISIDEKSFDNHAQALANNIISLTASGQLPVITHGNTRQLEKMLMRHPENTLAECMDTTRKQIGERLGAQLIQAAGKQKVKVLPTRVIVNRKDPAFDNPAKQIGPEFTIKELALGHFGDFTKTNEIGFYRLKTFNGQEWFMGEATDKEGTLRRVVPTPRPLKIYPQDLAKILDSLEKEQIVIAAGGGGIPISRSLIYTNTGDIAIEEKTEGAISDHVLTSVLLARELKARELIISTSENYELDWIPPGQEKTPYLHASQALKNCFLAGRTIGKAANNALRSGVNTVLITSPEYNWTKNEGIFLTRGLDLSGRLYNFARMVGFTSP